MGKIFCFSIGNAETKDFVIKFYCVLKDINRNGGCIEITELIHIIFFITIYRESKPVPLSKTNRIEWP